MTATRILTPALALDLDAFESNLIQMARLARESGKALRPHFKAHKCVEVARRQIAAGACGVCVATLAEAEVAAKAGITGLLLTSPMADPAKMARIVKTGAMVVSDHVQQVNWYQEAAAAADRTVEVLVDLDPGDHRTGARSVEQAVEIAVAIDRASHLRLGGIQAYSVSGSHAETPEHKRTLAEAVAGRILATRDAFARYDLYANLLTGGSTGSCQADCGLSGLNELQAGSYALMDMAYQRIGAEFRQALTVLTTVISANHPGMVTVDGGYKAFSTDRGYGPQPMDLPGASYRWGGDEFGFVDVTAGDRLPELGEQIEFVPPHCDPTVNLHDRIYVRRGSQVEAVWPVMDRLTRRDAD